MYWAVILAGGVGRRFWPASTPERPKQLLPLAGDDPLVVGAVRRLGDLIPPERIVFVAGQRLADALRDLVPQISPENLLVEPRAASTAPALAWATAHVARHDPDAAILSQHADWAVVGDEEFRETAGRALAVATTHDLIATVGVPPTRPDPGLGYVVPGEAIDPQAWRVRRFVEKPEPAEAARLIGEGALWNSGLFAWRAERFTQEAEQHAVEFRDALPALRRGDVAGFFAAADPVPVDIAILERSRRVAVVPATFGWDDVGNWAALQRVNVTDAHGNVVRGPAALVDARDCVAWSEDQPVILAGVRGLVVVTANGRTLVTTREAAGNLKRILERLPPGVGPG